MNGEHYVTQAAWDLLSTFSGVLLAIVVFNLLEGVWNRKD